MAEYYEQFFLLEFVVTGSEILLFWLRRAGLCLCEFSKLRDYILLEGHALFFRKGVLCN